MEGTDGRGSISQCISQSVHESVGRSVSHSAIETGCNIECREISYRILLMLSTTGIFETFLPSHLLLHNLILPYLFLFSLFLFSPGLGSSEFPSPLPPFMSPLPSVFTLVTAPVHASGTFFLPSLPISRDLTGRIVCVIFFSRISSAERSKFFLELNVCISLIFKNETGVRTRGQTYRQMTKRRNVS